MCKIFVEVFGNKTGINQYRLFPFITTIQDGRNTWKRENDSINDWNTLLYKYDGARVMEDEEISRYFS